MWLLLIAVVLLILYIWWMSDPLIWKNKGIKWMIPWPIVGNTAGSLIHPYFDFWQDLYKKTDGNIVGFHIFSRPALLIRDPELIRQVLVSDADSYLSHAAYISESDVVCSSLMFSHGQEWYQTRFKLSPIFTSAKIKYILPIADASVDVFITQLTDKSKMGIVRIEEELKRLMTDITISTILGVEPECQRNPNSVYNTISEEFTTFMFGFKLLIGMMTPRLYEFLGLKFLSKKTYEFITLFLDKVIESRLNGEGTRPDIMQGLIELYSKDRFDEPKIKYNPDGTKYTVFNKDNIIAQAIVFILGSIETSTNVVSCILYELAKSPDVQDKLREEIMRVKSKNNGNIGYDEIKEMPYMTMVLTEAMRIHPPTPLIPRECSKDTQLSGISVPKGTIITIPVVGVQTDPDHYPEPEKFIPERFASETPRDLGTYLPFGIGPRQCIGIRLSEYTLKLVVCRIIAEFNVKPCSKTPKVIRRVHGPSNSSKDGMPLIFEHLHQ